MINAEISAIIGKLQGCTISANDRSKLYNKNIQNIITEEDSSTSPNLIDP